MRPGPDEVKEMPSSDVSIPSVVYKYLSVEGGLASLRDMTIKFSRVGDFNDPFELMVGRVDDSDLERIVAEAYQAYQSAESWMSFCARFPYMKMEPLRNEAIFLGSPPDFWAFFRSAFERAQNLLASSIPDRANRESGIACFSSRKGSILMWSHYAEFHKGVVIGYKTKQLPELTPVRYSDKRYSIPLYRDKEPEWAKHLLATKFSDWAYEKEWRCLVPANRLTISDKGNFYVLVHQPKMISCIYMGIRVDETLRNECELFAKNHRACELYQASCHPTEFALEFNRVDA